MPPFINFFNLFPYSDLMLNLIFLGPPGTGKGTVSQAICEKFSLFHLSTGDLIREEIASGSDLGKELEEIINAGNLVDDERMSMMLEKKFKEILEKKEFNGVIFDGFPRTLKQAINLNSILSNFGQELRAVIYIDSDEEKIVERLSSRWICPHCKRVFNSITMPPVEEGKCDFDGSLLIQRDDDKPETIRKRFKSFLEETTPLIDYYEKKGLLKKYDGNVPPQESILRAEEIVNSLKME